MVRRLVGVVRVMLGSWVIHHVYGKPHRDRSTRVCVFVLTGVMVCITATRKTTR